MPQVLPLHWDNLRTLNLIVSSIMFVHSSTAGHAAWWQYSKPDKTLVECTRPIELGHDKQPLGCSHALFACLTPLAERKTCKNVGIAICWNIHDLRNLPKPKFQHQRRSQMTTLHELCTVNCANRPSRSRTKDNPYTIFATQDTGAQMHYYVRFCDSCGRNQEI